ncbi:MAG: Gfo/Idh/MocA family oxidoreductase [Microthrixaceae bacterium]|nr:Gfo/Idh/MocA family oxidoreductase [Microthrixaceae bacterium]
MLRLGVIGTGIMGANHVRVGAAHHAFDIVAVVDPQIDRARSLADRFESTAYASLDECIGQLDCAIVATPTEFHFETAQRLLKAGVHVLVEKPITTTVDEANELIAIAERHGVVLSVGHVERFNPAVLELPNLVKDPIHITANRVSPYSPRVTVGVVLDLMVHDLDILAHLSGGVPASVKASAKRVRSDSEDLATALITFDNGVTATATASRVGQQKIREITITQPENYIAVDLLRQDVTLHRVDHSEYLSSEGARYRQTGVVEIPFLEHRGEPLALEHDDFAAAINDRRPPRVSGKQGAAALALALSVLEAAG